MTRFPCHPRSRRAIRGTVPTGGTVTPRIVAFLVLVGVIVVGAAASAVGSAGDGSSGLIGFSEAAARRQLQVEETLAAELDAERTGRHFRYLTEEPHVAGSERNRELAVYVQERFEEYGLEDVRLHRYDVLLPYPDEVSVTMVEPERLELSLREDGYPEDKDSYDADVGMTYMGMSASGDVTAELIYAHSGNPEDYDWLESQGIDPAGKIAIVRYSVPYSYRGFKAWEAERRGVKALLVYSDPMEDGYRKGLTFPDGPWGPASHIQRGAITYDFIVPGDPLTPGWPSVEGAERIAVDEARSVPGIIAVPMSWRDARPLLEALGGPVAPYDWQGGLPFTYRVGPGATKVRVNVQMDGGVREIQVVEGRIRGSEHPDELVVLGNHRDAWAYGGVDPSSGTATQLELARALGQLKGAGHRPRRSVVLASWDAEEWHLTGSTEWGEQFADELMAGAVAYLNVDSSTSGPEFGASATAGLDRLVVETVRDVIDPNERRSVLYAWQKRLGREPTASALGQSTLADAALREAATTTDRFDPRDLVANELGSGSDYTVFLNFLGVPIVSMGFDGPYGVYHSQYDDFYWMSRFGDPGFRYMTAMAEVWGRMGLRLANAEILPYELSLYAERVSGFVEDLAERPGVANNLDLSAARQAVGEWSDAAERLEAEVQQLLDSSSGASRGHRFDALNDALLRVERQMLLEEGIPDRPWFKHVLYAPKYTYAAMSIPGVTEAVDEGDWARARKQLDAFVARLDAVSASVEQALQRARDE